MGVWIETDDSNFGDLAYEVTPCMGVWIETYSVRRSLIGRLVTPCMGVWIETLLIPMVLLWVFSHTLYGCVD